MNNDSKLLDYKHKCYDDLSVKMKHILDQVDILNYFNREHQISSTSIVSIVNIYIDFVEDCQTYREVTLLYNTILEFLDPVDFKLKTSILEEQEKLLASLEEKIKVPSLR